MRTALCQGRAGRGARNAFIEERNAFVEERNAFVKRKSPFIVRVLLKDIVTREIKVVVE
jgi:hypothetical protein